MPSDGAAREAVGNVARVITSKLYSIFICCVSTGFSNAGTRRGRTRTSGVRTDPTRRPDSSSGSEHFGSMNFCFHEHVLFTLFTIREYILFCDASEHPFGRMNLRFHKNLRIHRPWRGRPCRLAHALDTVHPQYELSPVCRAYRDHAYERAHVHRPGRRDARSLARATSRRALARDALWIHTRYYIPHSTSYTHYV